MSNLLATIGDFVSVLILGSAILLFAGEVRLAMMKQVLMGTPKLKTFSERMTGEEFDLSKERVYGK